MTAMNVHPFQFMGQNAHIQRSRNNSLQKLKCKNSTFSEAISSYFFSCLLLVLCHFSPLGYVVFLLLP